MRHNEASAGILIAFIIASATGYAEACTCGWSTAWPEIFVATIVEINDPLADRSASASPRRSRIVRYQATEVLKGSQRKSGTLQVDHDYLFCGPPLVAGDSYIVYLQSAEQNEADPCSFQRILDQGQVEQVRKVIRKQ